MEAAPVNVVRFLMTRLGTPHSTTVAAATASSSTIPSARAPVAGGHDGERQRLRIPLTRKVAQALVAAGAISVNGMTVYDAEGVTVRTNARIVFVLPPSSSDGAVAASAEKKADQEEVADVVRISADAIDRLAAAARVWLYNKPVGVDCNMVERDSCSLVHVLRRHGLLGTNAGNSAATSSATGTTATTTSEAAFPIGRLDKDSCGLLLLTTSGALCERLLHPAFDHVKEYRVTVNRVEGAADEPPPRFYEIMSHGVTWYGKNGQLLKSASCVVLPNRDRRPLVPDASVENGLPAAKAHRGEGSADGTGSGRVASAKQQHQPARSTFTIQLGEGMNRQIRNMVESAGNMLFDEAKRRATAATTAADSAAVSSGGNGIDAAGAQSAAADAAWLRAPRLRVTRLQRRRVGPIALRSIAPPSAADAEDDPYAPVDGEPHEVPVAEGDVVELTGAARQALLDWVFGSEEEQQEVAASTPP